jgi:septum formation protein
VSGVDEIDTGDPVEAVRENARRKAEHVASTVGPSLRGPEGETPSLVLGVDTDVVVDGDILGKPRDIDHAAEILTRLSGRSHTVVSGLALIRDGHLSVVDEATEVVFRDLTAILQWYLETEEWRDRAGGYAIQGRGAAFVREIRGDYLNVVGLPVTALLDLAPDLLKAGQ